MFRRLAAWWRWDSEIRFLEGLSDRMLADMGLRREEIRERVLARETPRPSRPGILGGLPEIVS